LKELPLTIDVQNSADVGYVRARIMAESARKPVGLVVIDYAGQMSESGTDRTEQLMQAVKGLHILAGDLDIPILLVSQVNREPSKSGDGHPQLHHLSYSDDLAKKPAMVVMLHHPLAHWDQTGRDNSAMPDPESYRVFVRKNKGPTGGIDMQFKKKMLRFIDPEDPEYDAAKIKYSTNGAAPIPTDDQPF
jgi:replicative DNA helicase